jgi:very-short-patch-repair endonuclease
MLDTIETQGAESVSIFQSNLPMEAKLDKARAELLDLSARNRLLNIPRSAKSARYLEIIDERSDEVFRLLVGSSRAMTFLAGKSEVDNEEVDDEEIVLLAQPDDDGVDERGVPNRHADTRLQTRLTAAGLQKRLLDLYVDARTLEEEQGVNILFLALGTLKWVDPTNPANVRYAPLVLLPVSLERGNAGEKFKLRWRQEDITPNLSLEAFLDRLHEVRLPALQADDDFRPSAYAAAVAEAVTAKPGWSVQPDDIVLGFFSFAKFLMYRDLDPSVWPAKARLSDLPLMRGLLSDGFEEVDDLLPEDAPIDLRVSPADMLHIVDCDSSQTLAVHEVRRGRNLVIQGPPGTGKSQTIANIIASAVGDGKTVLFVAEKMAALEVVKRRLDATGVGDACLELHSNKANKREVIKELDRTWQLGAPKGEAPDALIERLTEARDRLNAHVERMHRAHEIAQLSPYEVVGHLARIRAAGLKVADIALPQAAEWSPEDFRSRGQLLKELADRIDEIGRPSEHAWFGVGLDALSPMDRDRLLAPLPRLVEHLSRVRASCEMLAGTLEQPLPATLEELDGLWALAVRIATAPDLSPAALASSAWGDGVEEVDALLSVGTTHAERVAALSGAVTESAWRTDARHLVNGLTSLPDSFTKGDFADVEDVANKAPELLQIAVRLAEALGSGPPSDLRGIERLTRIADRVASAPPASPEAFAAELWNDGVEQAGDLAEAVARLEGARAQVADRMSDAAWDLDLTAARAILGAHGTSFLRYFNGEWRRADKLVRSVLSVPKSPLGEVLPLLDALGRGQAAQREIRAGEGLGAKAFGHHWRGERSTSGPLLALVAWMRTISDLGAEPRLIAANRPDQHQLQGLGEQVAERAAAVRAPLERLWAALDAKRADVLSKADGAASVDLLEAAGRLAEIAAVDAQCRGLLTPTPDSLLDRRARLTLLTEGQDCAAAIEANDALGRRAFDEAWAGSRSDWRSLKAAAAWIHENDDIRELASHIPNRSATASFATDLARDRDALVIDVEDLCRALKLDRVATLGSEDLTSVSVERLAARLDRWGLEPEALSKWVAYRDRALEARRRDLGELVERLDNGALPPADANQLFEMSVFEAVLNDLVRLDPEIGRFNGFLHSRLVSEFSDLDQQRIAQARLEVVRTHHRRIPPQQGGAIGPLGVLRGEIARKRGHMPIRQLMEKAAPALQAIKPVLMMSPLSVAQYLPPGALSFDLLVMDEASQIQPVDALGAVARCRQVVVVGDPQQLPPTAFFSKMTGGVDEEEEDDGGAKVADIESILGLFTARGLPKRMLRWHYRSRHQSLIAVSNSQFYESKLFIVPSPHSREAGMGLRFHHVPNGIFDTGKTRTNQVEAKAVARAIIDHAINHPNLTLGVAAFSSQQRRAIQDHLEILRRDLSPQHESFFQSHATEPFFVKNLENVQGDERDVIFISVGYAASTPGGKVAMRFGPLGSVGGDRRLNVLISRAKRRCEVFSSITDEDIDPDFAAARKGVFAFRLFLHFARTGRLSMVETTGSDRDGVLEAEVASALQARGYQVHRNVGVAGLFVDLAVADPERQGRYVLGVECDGVSYRAGRSARDRDRIRRTVLEDHGWALHRLWGADWFQRPGEELERIVGAIEASKAELAAREAAPDRVARAVPVELVSVEREDVTEIGLVELNEQIAVFVAPYQEATVMRPVSAPDDIHLTPTGALTHLAEHVIAREGPVHLDEVTARIRDAWGAGRAGGRIRDAVERAVAASVAQGRTIREEGFLWQPGCMPTVRDRAQVSSPGLRKPEMIPPTELRTAIVQIVQANFGATRDQIVQSVSRDLGFKATSAQLRGVIEAAIQRAEQQQDLERQDDLLVVGPNANRTVAPSPATEALLALIAGGESQTLEFKQTLRLDVQTQVLNRKLEDVVIKTIAAFANQAGGTLLIGVRDDGVVTGIEADYPTLSGGNRDKFELHLTHLVNSHFGPAFYGNHLRITFPAVGAATICRVDVQRSPGGVVVKLPDSSGRPIERFYLRVGNSTQDLSLSQMTAFMTNRGR